MYIYWRVSCMIPKSDTTMRITEVKLTKRQRVQLKYMEH